jgi:tRNA-dihydrouridine synthase B
MAGVTDRPFRQLCRELGAGYVVSEMVTSDPQLRNTRKSVWRSNFDGEPSPIAVQIVGGDPERLANAARYNVSLGAQIIDINMGCPAKKVCGKLGGSALLSDIPLVENILYAVVSSVDVPVTLKIRTGPHSGKRNGVEVAKIAESCGIKALAVHGRTRADRFRGEAEYHTIRKICNSVSIPVFANGDITTPSRAREVLEYTGADGLMLGRGAQGNPWIFREINHYLQTGEILPPPTPRAVHTVMCEHLRRLHDFYGNTHGVLVARKHIGWYLKNHAASRHVLYDLMRVNTAKEQFRLLEQYFLDPTKLAA